MPNQDPTQQNTTPPSFFPQEDAPPMPPDFQNVTEEKPTVQTVDSSAVQQPTVDAGSAAPADVDISSVIKSPKKKFGSGKIIATILGLFLLVGGVGAGIILTQQQQLFQQKADSCGGVCRENCLGSEVGQGVNVNGCTNGLISCIPSSCIDVPDAGTSCGKPVIVDDKEIPAGFCVPKDTCPAGKNRPGSCNTADTDCCTTASSTNPPNAVAGCIFDHYAQKQVCVQVNGTWQKCDTDPVGEMGGIPNSGDRQCKNTSEFDIDAGCSSEYPSCVTGPNCINTSLKCTPSVLQYVNCTSDSSCFPTKTPTPKPTPTKTPTPKPTPTKTPTPKPTPTKTPTPTPSPIGVCQNIKIYKGNSTTPLTSKELSSLKAGDSIDLCAFASSSVKSVRFTINSTARSLITPTGACMTARGTCYCDRGYIIPSGINSFNVKAVFSN